MKTTYERKISNRDYRNDEGNRLNEKIINLLKEINSTTSKIDKILQVIFDKLSPLPSKSSLTLNINPLTEAFSYGFFTTKADNSIISQLRDDDFEPESMYRSKYDNVNLTEIDNRISNLNDDFLAYKEQVTEYLSTLSDHIPQNNTKQNIMQPNAITPLHYINFDELTPLEDKVNELEKHFQQLKQTRINLIYSLANAEKSLKQTNIKPS